MPTPAPPLYELFYRLTWSATELARLFGIDSSTIHSNLFDESGERVKVMDLPPDGRVFFRWHGCMVPGRRGVNTRGGYGNLTFFRGEVADALPGGLEGFRRFHPATT